MKKRQAEITEEPIMNEQDEAIIEIEELAEGFTDEAEKVNIVSKTVYKTFYAVSFGVVFSSLLVAKLLVPKNSMAAKGIFPKVFNPWMSAPMPPANAISAIVTAKPPSLISWQDRTVAAVIAPCIAL
jgi:hypothetical protein